MEICWRSSQESFRYHLEWSITSFCKLLAKWIIYHWPPCLMATNNMEADEMPSNAYKQDAFISALSMLPPTFLSSNTACSLLLLCGSLLPACCSWTRLYHTVASFIANGSSVLIFPLFLYRLMQIRRILTFYGLKNLSSNLLRFV